jgi:hypothetical protein
MTICKLEAGGNQKTEKREISATLIFQKFLLPFELSVCNGFDPPMRRSELPEHVFRRVRQVRQVSLAQREVRPVFCQQKRYSVFYILNDIYFSLLLKFREKS